MTMKAKKRGSKTNNIKRTKKIGYLQAKKLLSTVRPDKSLWIYNGHLVNNLKNLPKAEPSPPAFLLEVYKL